MFKLVLNINIKEEKIDEFTLFKYNKYLIDSIALLVQLVERRFPKPDVEGSSPSGRV